MISVIRLKLNYKTLQTNRAASNASRSAMKLRRAARVGRTALEAMALHHTLESVPNPEKLETYIRNTENLRDVL